MYCHLFSHYVPVWKYKTNFEGEIEATYLALQQLIYQRITFQTAVLMEHTQAAIHAVALNNQPQSVKVQCVK